MLHKTRGIILHTTSYSESQLIAKVYTLQFGLQSYIISGIRGKKSKTKASVFQPLSLVDMVVSHTEKGGLQRISEINNAHPYTSIPYIVSKSSIVLFLNEILYKALNEAHPDEDLFEFIQNSLLILDLKTDSCSNFHIYFMAQLTKYLGFFPQGAFSDTHNLFDLKSGCFINQMPNHPHYLNDDQSQLFYTILSQRYDTLNQLRISQQQRKQLLQALISYFQFHIPSFKEINSLEVLEEVIS